MKITHWPLSLFLALTFLVSSVARGQDDVLQLETENLKKELVELGNKEWQAEYQRLLAANKEAERRGEFSSISPPKSLKPFKDWDYYYLDGSNMTWSPNDGQAFDRVIVPRGFVTDLTSIPKILWSLDLRPEGSYAYAAVIHDYLYWTQERSREESDLIFLYAMEDSKVDEPLRKRIYRVIRIAGGFAWNSNAKLKEEGEKRFLRKPPPDFTTTWEEWKATPGALEE